MQFASPLPGLSFRKNPRNGQKIVFDRVAEKDEKFLNIKLPTGYGKTYVATCSYSIKKRQNKVNRVLFIFASDAQLEQFIKDGPETLSESGVDGPVNIIDIRFFRLNAIKKHRKNQAQVYATTIQSLIQNNGLDIINNLLETGRWMIVVDEYHHYGIEKSWGIAARNLNCEFLLAMSATPYRKDNDSAFGPPHVEITYREAVKEKAVKPLKGHSYTYRIDSVMVNGEIISFTTDEFINEFGTDPNGIEAKIINRKMRWSAKYISPLLSIPIERLIQQRLETGYKLQAIVGAMCVSHAKMICEQAKSLFPELSIDWVGTKRISSEGEEYGRSNEENKEILNRFCPPKDENGNRKPSLDILVHVGMAGEGLDSINVSEVIHLNKASKNNSNDQENGRSARYLENVTGNINFDSSSDYAKFGYIGSAIMDAMDSNPPSEDEEEKEEDERKEREMLEIPDEPSIQIWDIKLDYINSGDPGVQRMAKVLKEMNVSGIDYESLKDLNSPEYNKIISVYRNMREKETEQNREKETIMQWKDAVNSALSLITGRVIRLMTVGGARIEKSLPGDIKKRINGRKKRVCGSITNDIEICKRHYNWIKSLETEIKERGIPQWLS